MLHHIYVAVDSPARVSRVLAEVLGGRSFPFPVHEESYIVIVGDGHGTAIAILPAGTQLTPALDEVEFSTAQIPPVFNSVHAAISVEMSEAEIEQIAAREGWLVRRCDRGPFPIIEFWVENKFLIELLTPELVSQYLQVATPESYEMALAQGLIH